MGFFTNPGKAIKGFVKDPVGRIGKDLDKLVTNTEKKTGGSVEIDVSKRIFTKPL